METQRSGALTAIHLKQSITAIHLKPMRVLFLFSKDSVSSTKLENNYQDSSAETIIIIESSSKLYINSQMNNSIYGSEYLLFQKEVVGYLGIMQE